MFVVGAMSLVWMGVLTLGVLTLGMLALGMLALGMLAEKLAPPAWRLSPVFGVLVIGWGLWLIGGTV